MTTSTPTVPSAAATASAPLPTGLHRVEAVDDTADPKTAEEFALRGNARASKQSFAGAISDLSEAIRLSPNTAAYYRDRAIAYSRSGEKALARADLSKALELSPDDSELLRMRAITRLVDNNRAGALADTEAAARLTPSSSLEAVKLAELFEHLNQPARAIPIYDAVIAAHRDDSHLGALLNGRCWVRALANVDLDKAFDDCNRAIKRDGMKAGYLDSRGLVSFRKRDFASAISDYDAALKLKPNLEWSLYVRGLAKIALGQIDAGKADQAAAVAIKPDIGNVAATYGVGS